MADNSRENGTEREPGHGPHEHRHHDRGNDPRGNDMFESIRENLNGRPGHPMLFGVCRTLAARSGMEPWLLRAVAILLVLFFTFPAVVAYVLLGLFLDETSDRTRGIFQGLFLTLREAVDKVVDGIGDLFKSDNGNARRY